MQGGEYLRLDSSWFHIVYTPTLSRVSRYAKPITGKEGWMRVTKIIAKLPLSAQPGWFTPSASVSVATRNFLMDAATPPCGDARGLFAARFKLISIVYAPRCRRVFVVQSRAEGL